MKYHQPTQSFVIDVDTIKNVAECLLLSLKSIRETGGKPLGPYDVFNMDSCDHAQAHIVEVARSLDIDLGHRRFNKIDLTNVN